MSARRSRPLAAVGAFRVASLEVSWASWSSEISIPPILPWYDGHPKQRPRSAARARLRGERRERRTEARRLATVPCTLELDVAERPGVREPADALRRVAAEIDQHLLGVLTAERSAAGGLLLLADTERRRDLADRSQPRGLRLHDFLPGPEPRPRGRPPGRRGPLRLEAAGSPPGAAVQELGGRRLKGGAVAAAPAPAPPHPPEAREQ